MIHWFFVSGVDLGTVPHVAIILLPLAWLLLGMNLGRLI